MRTPGRDRQHERVVGERGRAGLEHLGDVAGLHRHHEHVGVGGGPRRARHHPHAGQPRLELVAAVGVDLGDRERVGRPPAVEQAGRQRLAHAAAAQEAHVHPGQGNRGHRARLGA